MIYNRLRILHVAKIRGGNFQPIWLPIWKVTALCSGRSAVFLAVKPELAQ